MDTTTESVGGPTSQNIIASPRSPDDGARTAANLPTKKASRYR